MKITELFEKLHEPGDYFKYRNEQWELVQKLPNGDYSLKEPKSGKKLIVKKPDVVDLQLIDPPAKPSQKPTSTHLRFNA